MTSFGFHGSTNTQSHSKAVTDLITNVSAQNSRVTYIYKNSSEILKVAVPAEIVQYLNKPTNGIKL